MKNYTIVVWAPFYAHIAAESMDDINEDDILADLRTTYGNSVDRAIDFIDDYEIIDEYEESCND